MWLLDPRPDLRNIWCRMIEEGVRHLSEASSTPVMAEVRIRACHCAWRFIAKDNRRPRLRPTRTPGIPEPDFDYARICATARHLLAGEGQDGTPLSCGDPLPSFATTG